MSLLCFFAHHRCASSWANDNLRALCNAAGWQHRVVHDTNEPGCDITVLGHQHQLDLLTFSNARREILATLPAFKGIHLVRDPRDVLVSSYFSHRNSHPTDNWPELVEHRAELRAIPQREGLLLELECRAMQFEEMRAWPYGRPDILEWRMEDLVENPTGHLTELFTFWDRLDRAASAPPRLQVWYNRTAAWTEQRSNQSISLPRAKMEKIPFSLITQVAENNSYRIKTGGRIRGVQDPNHHYRAGTAGDWRNHFFEELTARFKAQYNDLLVSLCYEKNADW